MKLTNDPDHHSRAGLGNHPLFKSRVAEWVFGGVFWVLIVIGRGELPHVPVNCQCAECQAKREKNP